MMRFIRTLFHALLGCAAVFLVLWAMRPLAPTPEEQDARKAEIINSRTQYITLADGTRCVTFGGLQGGISCDWRHP